MGDVIDMFTEEAEQPPRECADCGGSGVIEERVPFIFGELVHRVRPCEKCGGSGLIRRRE